MLTVLRLVCCLGVAFAARAARNSVDVIDTHVHNANLSLLNYTFAAAFPDLARDWTIDDFSLAVDGSPVRVRGALLMELEKQHNTFDVGMEEARMFQTTADRCNRETAAATTTTGGEAGCVPVSGFVASAPLESEPAALDRYLTEMRTKYPALRGVRQPLWKRNASFYLGEAFQQGLGVLGRHGLPFDLLVEAAQLRDMATLAAQHPNVRFNLNHLGYPNTSSTSPAAFAAWAADISALATHANVYCKLSGLPQTYGRPGWAPNDFLPFVRHVLEAFGARRINFAGNWFVLMEERWDANYPSMSKAVLQTLDTLNVSSRDRQQILVDTATELYHLH